MGEPFLKQIRQRLYAGIVFVCRGHFHRDMGNRCLGTVLVSESEIHLKGELLNKLGFFGIHGYSFLHPFGWASCWY